MNTKLSVLCDKFIEACWLAALVLAPVYMNIYTHRMFEPDKACVIRSLALLMVLFYIIKIFENKTTNDSFPGSRTKSSLHANVPLGEDSSSKFTNFLKNSIFFPFLLFVTAYIISVIFSAVPYNSLWGGYDRLQGLYTNLSFWIIFILAAVNIKSKAQIERLISTVVFTSVPIVAYCFIQRFRWDPVPWQQMDPSIRVSATMGNPIFLSAYLIITIPLTISRFVRSLFINRESSSVWIIFSAVFYGLLSLLQVITVFLSQSRGPMLAMFASIFAFILVYAWANRKKKILISIIGAFILGIIFLFLFNIQYFHSFKNLPPDNSIKSAWQKTFGKLMNVPYLRQLGRILETEQHSSGRVRIILWGGVMKLITDRDEPYRFFIGYGPESLSTVYYKNYTMELATLEGTNVHADRSHNAYLDIWVMHGLFGLLSYIFLLGSIFYIALKTIRLDKKPPPNIPEKVRGPLESWNYTSNYLNLAMIGLLAAIIAHLVEIFVGIAIVSTFTHFWILAAAVYATHRIKSSLLTEELDKETTAQKSNKNLARPAKASDDTVQDRSRRQQPNKINTSNIPRTFHWGVYLFVIYIILTIVIAFILFKYSWPEIKMLTPEIKSTKESLLLTFCGWLLFGFIIGIVVWPSHLFWTYVCQTLIMAVIMVKKYWPDDTTNTDVLIIYSWLWILAGVIIGAVYLPREQKPIKFWHFSNVLLGSVMSIIVIFIIVHTNLYPLRADGFYKFCFSYDMSAEDFLKNNKMDAAYQTRLACVKYFQNALKYAPNERAYLNGSGRNFLELSKLVSRQPQKDNIVNKILTPPSIKEIVELDWDRIRNLSQRDFFICSVSCIQQAYELDLNNFERIIAMIRIYRYWGDLDKDITKFEKGLEFCKKARKASPLNTKVDDEIRELQRLISARFPK